MTANSKEENCIFCQIANGECSKTEILFQNESIVIFKDIKPASEHHYLAVPKTHIQDARYLEPSDKPLGKWSARDGIVMKFKVAQNGSSPFLFCIRNSSWNAECLAGTARPKISAIVRCVLRVPLAPICQCSALAYARNCSSFQDVLYCPANLQAHQYVVLHGELGQDCGLSYKVTHILYLFPSTLLLRSPNMFAKV